MSDTTIVTGIMSSTGNLTDYTCPSAGINPCPAGTIGTGRSNCPDWPGVQGCALNAINAAPVLGQNIVNFKAENMIQPQRADWSVYPVWKEVMYQQKEVVPGTIIVTYPVNKFLFASLVHEWVSYFSGSSPVTTNPEYLKILQYYCDHTTEPASYKVGLCAPPDPTPDPNPQVTYNCIAGQGCVSISGSSGSFRCITDCKNSGCPVNPNQMYRCDTNEGCVADPNGSYNLEQCGQVCCGGNATTMYLCDPNSKTCSANIFGTYTLQSDCMSACNPGSNGGNPIINWILANRILVAGIASGVVLLLVLLLLFSGGSKKSSPPAQQLYYGIPPPQ